MAVLQSYRLGKGRGKREENGITTSGIRTWSPIEVLKSPNIAERTKHVAVLVVEWLYAERIFSKIYKMRKGIEKNILYCMAGKIENKIFEEHKNENYYLLWWSDKRHFPYNCLGLSDEDNSVSRTDNFVNAIVFNSVTYSITGNRNFPRKEELIYETIAALITCNAGHLGWQHMRSFANWLLWRQNTIPSMHRDHW